MSLDGDNIQGFGGGIKADKAKKGLDIMVLNNIFNFSKNDIFSIKSPFLILYLLILIYILFVLYHYLLYK